MKDMVDQIKIRLRDQKIDVSDEDIEVALKS